jgi:fructose-specific phosphotransferase system component IIB
MAKSNNEIYWCGKPYSIFSEWSIKIETHGEPQVFYKIDTRDINNISKTFFAGE